MSQFHRHGSGHLQASISKPCLYYDLLVQIYCAYVGRRRYICMSRNRIDHVVDTFDLTGHTRYWLPKYPTVESNRVKPTVPGEFVLTAQGWYVSSDENFRDILWVLCWFLPAELWLQSCDLSNCRVVGIALRHFHSCVFTSWLHVLSPNW